MAIKLVSNCYHFYKSERLLKKTLPEVVGTAIATLIKFSMLESNGGKIKRQERLRRKYLEKFTKSFLENR